jgi:hypothetical protein
MKRLKWGVLALLAVGLAWSVFQVFSRPGSGVSPLKLTFLGMTNDAGRECALFNVSNYTGRTVVYMSDGTALPLYLLFHRIPLDAHTIFMTNYNWNGFAKARPADLRSHGSLTFQVYIPPGVTNAELLLSYEAEKNRLKEKAREVVESYGGQLPVSTPWKSIRMKQPFSGKER